MARVRWSSLAERDHWSLVGWLERHRGPNQAAEATVAIAQAIASAARNPELHAWVGNVHASLAVVPTTVRRVLTGRRRHVIYYRWHPDRDEIQILCIRGGAQRPPTYEELAPEDGPAG
jgi:plasmid stabilization system protein ParE